MFPNLRFSNPPDVVKGALDALQRYFIRFLGEEVKASSWMVNIADVASGWVVGKIFHLYKERYARSQRPAPTPLVLGTGCE